MLARLRSAAVLGIDAYLVEVEVDLTSGLPSFATVGLPQGAVREGRERVTAALVNSGFGLVIGLGHAEGRQKVECRMQNVE